MRPIACILFLMLCFSWEASAKKMPGVIIINGEVRNVTLNIPTSFLGGLNYQRLQYRIVYYDDSGKKIVVRPHEADEISFEYQGEEIRMVSVSNSVDGGNLFNSSPRIFLRLLIDGPLQLLEYHYQQSGAPIMGPNGMMGASPTYGGERYVLRKGNGEPKFPRTLSFRKDMTEYLGDCPDLVALLQQKEFRRNDLEEIVIFYNGKCN
jgi:hypothetical protein